MNNPRGKEDGILYLEREIKVRSTIKERQRFLQNKAFVNLEFENNSKPFNF